MLALNCLLLRWSIELVGFCTRMIVLQNCYAPISIGRVVNYNVTKSGYFQSTCLISRSAGHKTDEMKSRVEGFVCSVFPFHLRFSIQWGQPASMVRMVV